MDLEIKKFDVKMPIKDKGIEIDVSHPSGGAHIGDLVIKRKGLVWCKGRTFAENGISISWDEFIKFAEDISARKTSAKK